MATALTRYPGSSVVTETSAPAYSSGDDGLLDFFNEMARRRRSSQAKPKRKPALGARTVVVPRSGPGREGGNAGDLAQTQILQAQAKKARAEADAFAGRAPTRTSSVGGNVFQTTDPLKMTGAQRQAFLPGNSGMEAGGLSPNDALRLQRGSSFGPGNAIGGHSGGFKTVYGSQRLGDEYTPAEDPEFQAFLEFQARQRRG